MTVAVTGAAGYIGSHVARRLRERGEDVLAVDDMSAGVRARIRGLPLVEVDLAVDGAADRLSEAFRRHGVRGVVHLAARKAVGESVEQPTRYYHQNIAGLAHVIDGMRGAGVDRLVFSSSAAVYGSPAGAAGTISEDTPCEPINPYGQTKLAGEWLVAAAAKAHGLRAVSLRYFNVAGTAWPDLADVQTANLVPIVLDRHAHGRPIVVFGEDYPTPDGTCIRDYVHVGDLAGAHLEVLDRLDGAEAGSHEVFNVGTGTGASVREVVAAVGRALGEELHVEVAPRRPGDPARLVASAERIHRALGWRAEHDLDDIVASAVGARHG